jgi:biotin carboxyl carrier protein
MPASTLLKSVVVSSAPALGALLLCWASQACSPHTDHEEAHTHADEPEEEPRRKVTAYGANALVFIEHPHLVRGELAEYWVHVTVLDSGAPLTQGTLTLRVGDESFVNSQPKRDGLYIVQGSVTRSGWPQATLEIAGPQLTTSVALGEWSVHADRASARAQALAEAASAPSDGVSVSLETQWSVRMTTAEAALRPVHERIVVAGVLEPAVGAKAQATAAIDGALLPLEGGFPVRGQTVQAGDILAWVETPLSPSERAQQQALELELDLQTLAVTRERTQATAHLRYAEDELNRARALRERGLATQQRLDAAQQEVALAHSAQQTAEASHKALEALLNDRKARDPRGVGTTSSGNARQPVRAPITGIVDEVSMAAGTTVSAGTALCTIVNPKQLQVRAAVPEHHLARLAHAQRTRVTLVAEPNMELWLDAKQWSQPTQLEAQTGALAWWTAITPPSEAWRAGMSVRVEIEHGTEAAQLAIPAEAIVQDQGVPTVWVMRSGEKFERRIVTVGASNRDWVHIRAGIQAGERVAVRGANLVRLAALQPDGFGHGHAH